MEPKSIYICDPNSRRTLTRFLFGSPPYSVSRYSLSCTYLASLGFWRGLSSREESARTTTRYPCRFVVGPQYLPKTPKFRCIASPFPSRRRTRRTTVHSPRRFVVAGLLRHWISDSKKIKVSLSVSQYQCICMNTVAWIIEWRTVGIIFIYNIYNLHTGLPHRYNIYNMYDIHLGSNISFLRHEHCGK